MERPDFFSLKNGSKSKLPFSNKEYEERLLKIRTAQSEKGLNLKFGPEDTTLKTASEQLDEVDSKSQEIKDIAADYINCSNGN